MFRTATIVAVTAIGGLTLAANSTTAAPVFHPHFLKKIEVNLPGDLTLTVSHITVTLNKKGAEAMKPGGSWHLGNAHIENNKAIKIGGIDLPAGKHSIKAVKTDTGGWQLVVDAESRFRARLSDDAQAVKTDFSKGSAMFEHLSLDVQPSGDKSNTTLNLDVRWDTMLARALIEIPPAKKKTGR